MHVGLADPPGAPQIEDDLVQVRRGVQGKIEQLQRKRLLNLYPTLYVPPGWQPAVLEPPAVMFKVVAAAGGSFWSVYDGSTEYRVGKTTHTKHGASCWPALWGCFFAFPTLEQVGGQLCAGRACHAQRGGASAARAYMHGACLADMLVHT